VAATKTKGRKPSKGAREDADSDFHLVRELLELTALTFRQIPYTHRAFTRTGRLKASSRKLIQTRLERQVQACHRPGAVLELFWDEPGASPRSKRLLGAFCVFEAKTFYDGTPERLVRLHLRLGPLEPAANRAKILRWARAMLAKHQKQIRPPRLKMILDWPARILLRECVSRGASKGGLYIDSVVLLGDTRQALGALRRKYGLLKKFPQRLGLRVEPLRTRKQASECLRILKAEFTRNPQFGWFVATPGFLKMQEREYLASIRAKDGPYNFVILSRDGRIVGEFGFHPNPSNPFGATLGSMGFNFAPEIQGNGLAKYAYAQLLRELAKRRIPIFLGGTSQPGVLKLAKVMKRVPVSLELYPGKGFFPSRHFLQWLE
jgi:hypothetical protein